MARSPGEIPQPSAEVVKAENDIEAKILKPNSTSTKAEFPLRPGYGTQGRKILLWANYMELVTKADVPGCFRYSTDIGKARQGQELSVRKCRRIIELLLEQHFAADRSKIATDSRSNIVSSSELSQVPHDDNGTVLQVRWKAEDEDEFSEKADVYPVTVKFTMAISVSQLMNYLASSNANAVFASKTDAIHVLNIIVGEYPRSLPNVASIGSNKHMSLQPDREDRFALGDGLEAIRGYFVSVRAATSRILLNVQVKNIAVYESGGGLVGLIQSMHNSRPYLLERFLKMLRVQLTHLVRKGKPRQKAIYALANPNDGRIRKAKKDDKEKPPQVSRHGAGPRDVEFWVEEVAPKKGKKGPATAGRYISVADYFKSRMFAAVSDAEVFANKIRLQSTRLTPIPSFL
jgi:N-terminal domain of argonaute/Argonaute linker 1 domain